MLLLYSESPQLFTKMHLKLYKCLACLQHLEEPDVFIYLFVYLICLLFLAVLGLHCCTRAFQLRRARAALRCGARASHCGGFSCCRAQALGARASVVVVRELSSCGSRAPECRLSSCGARAQLLCGMWDLPRPGLEPVSPALAGGFLTTAPPGKPQRNLMFVKQKKRRKYDFL